ncbi:hypothetical protein SASPL_144704 [Salvia splendens]|uniref:BED-type domain-containing protein n=1 Tax=Salvia splendens TaxID=180675 RepID=A0A8X8WFA4_SALSN|nr:hypothetical protein SASPL_144704 [Salvia splendens]
MADEHQSQSAPGTQMSQSQGNSGSTAQRVAQANDSTDPAWKYCTMPDVTKKNSLKCNFCGKLCHGGITRIKYHLGNVPKSNVAKCTLVPSDVKEEMLQLLGQKTTVKQRKTKEKEEDRAVVDLSHSEGEGSDDGRNSVVALKRVRGGSSGGPIEKLLM